MNQSELRRFFSGLSTSTLARVRLALLSDRMRSIEAGASQSELYRHNRYLNALAEVQALRDAQAWARSVSAL